MRKPALKLSDCSRGALLENSLLGPQFARYRALILLILAVSLPVIGAEWFIGFRLFAFPFSTFLIAIVVPVALVVIALMAPRSDNEEPEEI